MWDQQKKGPKQKGPFDNGGPSGFEGFDEERPDVSEALDKAEGALLNSMDPLDQKIEETVKAEMACGCWGGDEASLRTFLKGFFGRK